MQCGSLVTQSIASLQSAGKSNVTRAIEYADVEGGQTLVFKLMEMDAK
jgi:hypothetical protein